MAFNFERCDFCSCLKLPMTSQLSNTCAVIKNEAIQNQKPLVKIQALISVLNPLV